MENDRTIRRLTALEQSASSARVLNLLSIHRRLGAGAPELAAAPFFRNRLLDRCIILKHRLRHHEYDYFVSPKPSATKILVPIDGQDLKVGARSVFVGQRDFEQIVAQAFGDDLKPGAPDRRVLDLIDALPSLDPFLLREQLRANGFEPDRSYFGISEADVQRMFDFVRGEITALVAMSSVDGQASHAHSSKLVDKLLSNTVDGGFEPLKMTLKLSDQEYVDGVFSWRGFLYYKWVLGDLQADLKAVAGEIAGINPRGPRSQDAAGYLAEAKPRIYQSVVQSAANAQRMLNIYNEAYAALTVERQPNAFRAFLLSAPEMFSSLGEMLGGVQHIISFWRYRFPAGKPRIVAPDELMDIFLDFEDSLAFAQVEPAPPAGLSHRLAIAI